MPSGPYKNALLLLEKVRKQFPINKREKKLTLYFINLGLNSGIRAAFICVLNFKHLHKAFI